jgi:integrase
MAGFPSRTASFKTLRLANRWARKIESEMDEGRHFRNAEARRRTVADAIDRYVQEELPKLRHGSMHKSKLPWWRKTIGTLKLSEVTPAKLAECRSKLKAEKYTRAKPDAERTTLKPGEKPQEFVRSDATVNRYLAVLSHVFTVAKREWHWLSSNPMEEVSRLEEGSGRVRFLSTDERKRLLAETAKDRKLHVFTMLALSTAARAGELRNLNWSDVELKTGRMLLRETKNTQPRAVWVQGEALRLLKRHKATEKKAEQQPEQPADDRIFKSPRGRAYGYADQFATACEAAKVADFTFHDLRHSAATYLAREGATEQQLRAIGGWKSTVVSRYVHLAAEDAKAVLAKMNRKFLGGKRRA